jgi:hypothetical protein
MRFTLIPTGNRLKISFQSLLQAVKVGRAKLRLA